MTKIAGLLSGCFFLRKRPQIFRGQCSVYPSTGGGEAGGNTMSAEQWNESGRVCEEDHGLLDDGQVAKCERADVSESLGSPVPTRMVSNGEYMPVPQTD